MAKNPRRVAEKWRDRIQASQQDMIDGVAAITEAPGKKAAAQADAMKARILEAINSGKWARNVSAVSLSDYQDAMTKIGIPRAVQGAADKIDKMESFLSKLLPYAESVRKQIAAMPNTTDADKKARMNKAYDLMKAFKK